MIRHFPVEQEGSQIPFAQQLPTMGCMSKNEMGMQILRQVKVFRYAPYQLIHATSSCGQMIYIYQRKSRAYPGVNEVPMNGETHKIRVNVEKSINHFQGIVSAIANHKTQNEKRFMPFITYRNYTTYYMLVASKIHQLQYMPSFKTFDY